MTKITKLFIGLVLVATPLTPLHFAQATSYYYGGEPKIEVESLSQNRFQITVSNAASYSTVDLYNHQTDSELWNGILNIGTTDRNGRFTTTRTFNSFHPELGWVWYADVGGRSTPTINTGARGTGTVLSDTTYNSGTLVLDRGTVYLIYRDQKIGFSSQYVFQNLGFQWSSVIYGDTSSIPLVYIVTNSTYSHPWGSWVKDGDTIYFVHENGLIPVSSYSIFLDNGGLSQLVVPANWYDLQLHKLSKMVKNDSRLK